MLRVFGTSTFPAFCLVRLGQVRIGQVLEHFAKEAKCSGCLGPQHSLQNCLFFEQTNIYVIKSIFPCWQNALGVWDLNIPCKTASFLSKQIFMCKQILCYKEHFTLLAKCSGCLFCLSLLISKKSQNPLKSSQIAQLHPNQHKDAKNIQKLLRIPAKRCFQMPVLSQSVDQQKVSKSTQIKSNSLVTSQLAESVEIPTSILPFCVQKKNPKIQDKIFFFPFLLENSEIPTSKVPFCVQKKIQKF